MSLSAVMHVNADEHRKTKKRKSQHDDDDDDDHHDDVDTNAEVELMFGLGRETQRQRQYSTDKQRQEQHEQQQQQTSKPCLLPPSLLSSVMQPQPYYPHHSTMRDNDQLVNVGQSKVRVLSSSSSSTVAAAADADYVRIPNFALLDEGQHGPHISDHSIHRLRYDGYWEQRINKLKKQQPMKDIYQHTQMWKGNKRGKQMEASASSSPSPSPSPSSSSSSPLPLFTGCVCYINGRTEGGGELSAHALNALIRLHGGECTPLLNRTTVTHIIAGNLTLQKNSQEVDRVASSSMRRTKKHIIECVRAEWIRDSIQSGKRLKEEEYRIVRDPTQRKLTQYKLQG